MNSYQEYKNFKFHQSMKAFKRDHPYIKIKAPRMKKDRNPPPPISIKKIGLPSLKKK